MKKYSVLLIDDDNSINVSLKKFFSAHDFKVYTATTGLEGIRKFESVRPKVVILDLYLPDKNGVEIAKKIFEADKNIVIIIITGYGSIDSARELFKIGVADYILKPFELDELYHIVKKELDILFTKEENVALKQKLINDYKPNNIIGESRVMKDVFKQILQVASYNINVLMEGESGTGKSLLAHAIHYSSNRRDMNFYTVDCSNASKELLEYILFGYDAHHNNRILKYHRCIFEASDNSTLFFDNIDRLPLDIQAKLLRILQDKKITCFHSNKEKNIDVRIISSASENLTELVANNKFRKDLFYRINIFTIKVPPLRDRKEDIPLLINHFIKKYSSIIGKRISGITDKALKKCMDYNWPGNVRELENVVQRAIVLANDEFINVNNILLDETSSDMPDYYTLSYKDALRNAVKEVDSFYIKQALVKCNYNKKKAAALLGISIRTLHYKLQHLDI